MLELATPTAARSSRPGRRDGPAPPRDCQREQALSKISRSSLAAACCGRTAARFRDRHGSLADRVDERGGARCKSGQRHFDRRGHGLDLIGTGLTLALRPCFGERVLIGGDLRVQFSARGTQHLGAVLDRTQLGVGAFELGVARAGNCKLFGCRTLFRKLGFDEAQAIGELYALGLLALQRSLEALDGTELSLEKRHDKSLMGNPD